MGILNKKTSADTSNLDKWKNKYYELLDEIDTLESTHQDEESLLCKTIIRLSLASTGFNKKLDPHLLRIRQQLKKGLKSDQLKTELEKFSNALMTLEESGGDGICQDPAILFSFLFDHFPEQKTALQQLEEKFKNNHYANIQYLFVDINDLIDSVQQIQPVSSTYIQSIDADQNAVNEQILLLLECTEIPPQFQQQANKLKDKLHLNEPLVVTLEEAASLLFQIKKFLQFEQQEMAQFLAQLTDQLTELGIQATGTNSISKSATEKRNLLDQSVSSQMIELQTSSKNATQLEPLKQLIHTRLADITQQIHNQQAHEQTERNKVHQQLDSLTKKISEMEQESSLLQNKLDTAYQKATHDPLTSLPNRLAYDERIATELARWKRYKSPLSLLIWDIDFFKKINDNFGHKSGDKTLILIAKLLSHHCRETDFVSRFGGEEFTMLLTDTDSGSALITANKIRRVIEKTAFNSNGRKISITVSCGIAQFTEEDTELTAFNRADKALYAAKNQGRNLCIVS